jgi:hypothetical protein
MTPKRFKTKIDRWLLLPLVTLTQVVLMSIASTWADEPREATFLVVTALAIFALIGSRLIGTHFAVFGRDPGGARR